VTDVIGVGIRIFIKGKRIATTSLRTGLAMTEALCGALFLSALGAIHQAKARKGKRIS
jgi:hypothetical protein